MKHKFFPNESYSKYMETGHNETKQKESIIVKDSWNARSYELNKEKKLLVCPVSNCKSELKEASAHILKYHKKIYLCSICNNFFSSPEYTKKHMNSCKKH